MLDHALGRPSPGIKRLQVVFTTLAAVYFLRKSSRRPPHKVFKIINKWFKNMPAWKIVMYTLVLNYFSHHLILLLGFNPPEPLAKMYTRSFFRATWIMNAMDAGFLTCMRIKTKWLRDILSVVMTVFYLFFPESAHVKVNKYPATIEVMRTCWEKSTNPIFYAITYFDRGYLRIRKDVIIPRPEEPSVSSFDMDLPPIKARLYFPGTEEELAKATQLIFDVPGGGFVTMHPKNHDDYLSCWSRDMKIPVISIDYGKAPEYPYPWALEECFDAYRSILETNGACIGLEGWYTTDENGQKKRKDPIKIVMVGDSAGGNLCSGVVMKCIEFEQGPIRVPTSLFLIYGCLSFDIACWMPADQMELIRSESTESVGKYVRTKTELDMTAPLQVDEAPRAVNLLTDEVDSTPSWYTKYTPRALIAKKAPKIHSGLSMTSRMSYFSDRIIKPELIRAMAIMYLANSPFKPDVLTDYYLSPITAPESILAQFPKTYLLCGEKDPFIDDTVVFAARIREAKRKARLQWESLRGRNPDFNDHLTLSPRDSSIEMDSHPFSKDPSSMVKVKVLPGMSHAIFQMMNFLPEAKQAVRLTTDWITAMFNEKPSEENPEITSMIISEMNEICEKSVFLRRRNSMASRIGFGKN